MKSSSEEKARLRTLLSNAISVLCKTSLGLVDLEFSVEAFIGISVNDEDVMVLSIKETVLPDGGGVSYIWQKESDEDKICEVNDEDLRAKNNALLSAEQIVIDNAQDFGSEQNDGFQEIPNPSNMRIKIEKDSLNYEDFSNNFGLSDSCDMSSSSPHRTNLSNISSANKRRKQSLPIRVCKEQVDIEEMEGLESRGSFNKRLAIDQDYVNSSRYTSKVSNECYDSTVNGEFASYSVPSKQLAHKSSNMSKSLKKGSTRMESGGFTGNLEYANDTSPNCSFNPNEQDMYTSQPENYTYHALNSTYAAGSNGKRKKQITGSSSKNMSEQDSLIISELLPYLYDQHRPMLIPPTVTQFAPKKRCRVCYSKKIRKEVRYCCYGCSDHPGLCLDPCFYQFHLVRGSAHPKSSESNYLLEVPSENDMHCADDCGNFNDVSAEMI